MLNTYNEVSSLIWLYDFFNILINPFTTKLRYYQVCHEYILTRNSSLPVRDEVITDLMLANMNNDISPLVSTIILSKMSSLCYPQHIEILAVIYWNLCVALQCQKAKWIAVFSNTKSWL